MKKDWVEIATSIERYGRESPWLFWINHTCQLCDKFNPDLFFSCIEVCPAYDGYCGTGVGGSVYPNLRYLEKWGDKRPGFTTKIAIQKVWEIAEWMRGFDRSNPGWEDDQ